MKIKILVVEDEPVTKKTIQRILEKSEYEVTLASNGKEGLQMVKSKMMDLIVTDYMMPKMDGLEFFKKMRLNKATEHIPIIILTKRSDMQSSFEYLGVDCFLSKPVHPGILLINVALFIQRNKKIKGNIFHDWDDDEKFSESYLIEKAKEGY